MESSKSEVLDPEQLADFSKALKDYKSTGAKQCLSIIKTLLNTDITINQLKESKIGASLSKITKEESNEPEDKELKEAVIQLFQKTKKREEAASQQAETKAPVQNNQGNGAHENKAPPTDNSVKTQQESNNKKEERKIPEERPIQKKAPEPKKEEVKREEVKKEVRPERPQKQAPQGIDKLPKLEPDFRNFTLKGFSDALIVDYKGNQAKRESLRPVANQKALDLESALYKKTRSLENDYRMEARNLSIFLMMKTNIDLRKRLMEGSVNCEEFVSNKEKFLNQNAKDKINEVSRNLLDAANADYDKKVVRESQLYQCKKCKSRKISKSEKQTRSGDEPMTSFFNCADCGAGWKE